MTNISLLSASHCSLRLHLEFQGPERLQFGNLSLRCKNLYTHFLPAKKTDEWQHHGSLLSFARGDSPDDLP